MPQFDPKTFDEYKKRFKEEARTLEYFNGAEGIVHVLDIFEENNNTRFYQKAERKNG